MRSPFQLGLRISRETYATINKRSSLPRWHREENPELWDSLDWSYEDAEHRFHSDEWCEEDREKDAFSFGTSSRMCTIVSTAASGSDAFEAQLLRSVLAVCVTPDAGQDPTTL
ncbi:hypothetical protein AKG07_03285 [Microbacterium sp. CGR1]|nr:hypothetical protein AKG07_03285 [Microbacterium sp. CGR1]